ncbi:hypothetical protein HRR83_005713 [Exophiala dermatitidis]|uniref:Salicylate hydroxylase n=2 Tax=Exophiala dermatitidis TaxID=5970 RepID=H6BVH5_EXODN|nr:salicylate hydroxylase [Exophiala dermatitidis NIH/UT8656]KAJ4508621.1 hypothetical protein HRR73_007288 [Exophiala dermatitidis]EHY55034.1 salicylate hydroxylase [Exophiala dermatitidis NIH/UT8656]KAJ4510876.1 hypothetical protein HRR75_005570 [Exophiala dermatitidis]KAJ4513269.1 hypothetical protein HRR74_006081 [Exophiala dermatitidis]KAJ4547247.1 hypothetical protein HRR78_005347 [Exophiala dermatitidis]
MTHAGLRVVIVGAGFCGLTAAIECKLKGMHPILVETYPTSRTQGDALDFLPNGGRIFNSWDNGRVGKRLLSICVNTCKYLDFLNPQEQLLCREPWNKYPHHYEAQFAGHRGELHEVISDYAREIGVEFQFGKTVVQYLDTETELGVLTKDGEKILGDVVLACDGPRSLARSQVLGLPDNKVNSGYAIYRAYYELSEEQQKNPLIAKYIDVNEDKALMHVGRDMHSFVYTWRRGTHLVWVLTHKDENDIGESWSFPGNKADVMHYLEQGNFSESFKEMVRNTPDDRLVDYKLVWRDALQTWLSPSKRIILMGDAAHCHLPTSAQGACQAVEDAVTFAVCLEKAAGDVPLALQVAERVRFNRSHTIHQSSLSNRDSYHNWTWTPELAARHPGALTVPRPDWIVEFDARKTAEENFDQLASDVKSGKQGTIEELALPAGGSFDIFQGDVDSESAEKAAPEQTARL